MRLDRPEQRRDQAVAFTSNTANHMSGVVDWRIHLLRADAQFFTYAFFSWRRAFAHPLEPLRQPLFLQMSVGEDISTSVEYS